MDFAIYLAMTEGRLDDLRTILNGTTKVLFNGDDGNHIVLTVNEIKILSAALKTNTTITTLDIYHNNLDPKKLEILLKDLMYNNTLKNLNLNGNDIGDEGIEIICKYLTVNSSLVSLHLRYNKITYNGIQHLYLVLKDSLPLQFIELGANTIGEVGGQFLGKLLEENVNLKTLRCAGCGLGDDGIKHIGKAIAKNRYLTEIQISGNGISNDGARYLIQGLKSNKTLECFDFSQNGMSLEVVDEVKLACRGNEKLKHLWQRIVEKKKNYIKNKEEADKKLKKQQLREYFIAMRRRNNVNGFIKSLKCSNTTLDLAEKEIDSDGLVFLSKVLRMQDCEVTTVSIKCTKSDKKSVMFLSDTLCNVNCKLHALYVTLSANSYSSAPDDKWEKVKYLKKYRKYQTKVARPLPKALMNTLSKLTTLKLMLIGSIGKNNLEYLWGMPIGSELAYVLQNSNCKLHTLHLTSISIGDLGLEKLSEAFRHDNCQLKVFSCSDDACGFKGRIPTISCIGDKGVIALANALKHPKCNLTEVRLRASAMESAGAIALAQALQDPNCKLTGLHLLSGKMNRVAVEEFVKTLVSKNSKLKSFTLNSELTAEGAEDYLLRVFKSPHCKLTWNSFVFNKSKITVCGLIELAKAMQIPNGALSNATQFPPDGMRLGSFSDNSLLYELVQAFMKPHSKLPFLGIFKQRINCKNIGILSPVILDPRWRPVAIDFTNSDNNIQGIKDLAILLIHPECPIKILRINGKPLGKEGLQILLSVLTHNACKLETLNIPNQGIDKDGVIILSRALENKNCKLIAINLASNNLDATLIKIILNSLENPNCKLKTLNLEYNRIGNDGFLAILQVLKSGKSCLSSINFNKNYISTHWSLLAKLIADPQCKLNNFSFSVGCPIYEEGYHKISFPDQKMLARAIVTAELRGKNITGYGNMGINLKGECNYLYLSTVVGVIQQELLFLARIKQNRYKDAIFLMYKYRNNLPVKPADIIDTEGNTPLHIAVQYKVLKKFFPLLLLVPRNKKNKDGLTALDIAKLNNYTEAESILKIPLDESKFVSTYNKWKASRFEDVSTMSIDNYYSSEEVTQLIYLLQAGGFKKANLHGCMFDVTTIDSYGTYQNLKTIVSAHPSLEILILTAFDEHVEDILSKNNSIRELKFSSNSLGNIGALELIRYLLANDKIKTIHLDKCNGIANCLKQRISYILEREPYAPKTDEKIIEICGEILKKDPKRISAYIVRGLEYFSMAIEEKDLFISKELLTSSIKDFSRANALDSSLVQVNVFMAKAKESLFEAEEKIRHEKVKELKQSQEQKLLEELKALRGKWEEKTGKEMNDLYQEWLSKATKRIAAEGHKELGFYYSYMVAKYPQPKRKIVLYTKTLQSWDSALSLDPFIEGIDADYDEVSKKLKVLQSQQKPVVMETSNTSLHMNRDQQQILQKMTQQKLSALTQRFGLHGQTLQNRSNSSGALQTQQIIPNSSITGNTTTGMGVNPANFFQEANDENLHPRGERKRRRGEFEEEGEGEIDNNDAHQDKKRKFND